MVARWRSDPSPGSQARGGRHDEMAAATGATVAALKMRVQRGCRRLRALLTAPTPAPAPTLERTDA